MRERLTVAFVVLTLSALAGVLFARSYSLRGELREHEVEHLRGQAGIAALAIDQRLEQGRPVDRSFLATLGGPDTRVRWESPGGAVGEAAGARFAADSATDARLEVQREAGGGRVEVAQAGDVVEGLAGEERRSVIVLLLLATVFSGLLAWLAARSLSAPFRRLATAADLLGRGRFDLDLPRSRLPEVQAISQALRGAAGRLQERLTREQEFAQHASHVLRTPLTGLRLELEELTLRDDVPDDARDTVRRSLDRIDSMDVVAGELVELSRRGALVSGSEVAVRELATQVAQRWADALAESDRALTAAVEGNLETTYTPGPVEHILDLLLVDVLRRSAGAVRVVFDAGADGMLRIRLTAAEPVPTARGARFEVPLTQARAVTSALGGRLVGQDPADGLEVLLPRR